MTTLSWRRAARSSYLHGAPGLERGHRGPEGLTLWEEQRFETLLQRAEEQLLLKRKTGKRRKTSGPSDPSERGDRARRTAAVGAYRKATTGLVSSMLSFNEQEDVRWDELRSDLQPWSICCDPHLAPPPGMHLGQALLWFALCGSNRSWPDCTRPSTSLTCNVPRIHANKIHAVLSALFCRISAGTLPPAARWLTRTRFAGNARRTANRVPSRWASLSLRQAPGEPVPGAPPHRDLAHASVGCQLARSVRALCHWRGTIEPLVLNGTLEPLVRRPTWTSSHVWQR